MVLFILIHSDTHTLFPSVECIENAAKCALRRIMQSSFWYASRIIQILHVFSENFFMIWTRTENLHMQT